MCLRGAGGVHGADGSAIALAPSATVLLRPTAWAARLRRQPARTTPASPLLALGYNDQGGDQPLRYAEAEADYTARMLGGPALWAPSPSASACWPLASRRAGCISPTTHSTTHTTRSESELRTGSGEIAQRPRHRQRARSRCRPGHTEQLHQLRSARSSCRRAAGPPAGLPVPERARCCVRCGGGRLRGAAADGPLLCRNYNRASHRRWPAQRTDHPAHNDWPRCRHNDRALAHR